MNARIVSSIASVVAALATAPLSAAPAYAQPAQTLQTVHCRASCSVTLGTNSSHNLHLWTTGLDQYKSTVYILDTETGVYVYNVQHTSSYRDWDVWVGGLYGQHYVADVYCPSCGNSDQQLYLANF